MPFTEVPAPSWDGSYSIWISKTYPSGSEQPGWETITVGAWSKWAPSVGDITAEQYETAFEQFCTDAIAAGFEVGCEKYYSTMTQYIPPLPE